MASRRDGVVADDDDDENDEDRLRSSGTSRKAFEWVELRHPRVNAVGGTVSPAPGVGGACEMESSDDTEENDSVGVRTVA